MRLDAPDNKERESGAGKSREFEGQREWREGEGLEEGERELQD